MQVVIDIDDRVYEMVMNTGSFGNHRFNTSNAIRKGTPLPKGHGRLKDVDAIIEKSWDADCRCGFVQVVDVGEILEAPTIIKADGAESEET